MDDSTAATLIDEPGDDDACRLCLSFGGVRALYLIEDLDEIEPGALLADSRLGFDLVMRHRDALVRSAIVTDLEWMARAAKMFAWIIPGEARVFPRAELEQAKTWVAGDEATASLSGSTNGR